MPISSPGGTGGIMILETQGSWFSRGRESRGKRKQIEIAEEGIDSAAESQGVTIREKVGPLSPANCDCGDVSLRFSPFSSERRNNAKGSRGEALSLTTSQLPSGDQAK